MRRFTLSLLLSLTFIAFLHAQTDNLQLGSSLNNLRTQNQGALYDYSDPDKLNIKLNVWGFVKFPGRYIVPENTTVNELITLAGGPMENANLEQLRLFRPHQDSLKLVSEFNYNDMMWEKEVKKVSFPPKMVAGDYLIVPGLDRLYFREYLTMGLAIVSTLVSIAILVINVVKK